MLAKLPPAAEEAAAEEEAAAAELAASVAAADADGASVAASGDSSSSTAGGHATAAPAPVAGAPALAAGSSAQEPVPDLAAPVCQTEIAGAVEEAKPTANGQQQQQQQAPQGQGAAKQGAVWGVTGNAQVDMTLTEWREWALSHKGSLLAGAGVVVGLVLVLGGNRRRFI